nr:hypothetical protein [Tanacetum cinerariifolium]
MGYRVTWDVGISCLVLFWCGGGDRRAVGVKVKMAGNMVGYCGFCYWVWDLGKTTPRTLARVTPVFRTMDTTIEQAAMDEALVPHAQRDMLHICSRVHGQTFTEPPFEEEILSFIRLLGHSVVIMTLIDVNINKLYQPWRSFTDIINKCLTGKSSGYDSLRLSQGQILWGLYHNRNVDYAYLMWDDFVYQVEHKNHKKSNEMYYPRFTKVIIYHFMSKDPSIPRRNKSSPMKKLRILMLTKSIIPLPHELHHLSLRLVSGGLEVVSISITPPTAAAGPRLTTSQKGKQVDKASKAKNEGTGSIPGVPDVPTDGSKKKLSWNSTNDKGDADEGKDGDGDDDDNGDDGEEVDGDDDDEEDQEVVRDDDKDDENDDEEEDRDDEEEYDEEIRDDGEEGHVEEEEEEEDELYKDVNINQGKGLQTTLEVEDSHVTLTPVNPDGMESIFETTSQMDTQTPTSVAPFPMTAPTMTPSTIATITRTSQVPILPTTVPSTIIQNLPSFGSLFGFDNRLRTLEANFSEFMQMNQFVEAVSSDRLRDEAQRENDESLKTVDENMQNIIKEQVKKQVKVQVSKILLRIKQAVNEQLEAEVLTQSSHSSKTSYAVAADLSVMELKSAGRLTQGSQSRQASTSESVFTEEPGQTTCQMEEPSHPEFDTGAEDQPIVQSSQHPEWFSQQQKPPSPDRDWNKTGSCKSLVELEYHLEEVFKATTYQLDWVNPKDYGHIKWIEDLVPRTMWIKEPIGYDKHALWGSPTGGVNFSSSTVLLLTGSLLTMCILREESLQSLNSRL